MEKTIKKLFVLGICLTTLSIGCTKDEATPAPVAVITPPPPPAPNQLCNGDGSTDYFPFNTGNTWSYETTSTDVTNTYDGTKTINNVLYNKIESVGDWTTYVYYRYDSNGDLYRKSDSFGSIEKIIVPGTPSVGQTWTDPNSNATYNYTYEVISTNASLTTPSCSYSGLIEINELLNGNISHKRYYKVGLGMVQEKLYGVITTTKNLKSVTLN